MNGIVLISAVGWGVCISNQFLVPKSVSIDPNKEIL